ncbi:MAG TPA: hypothetical protein VGO91_02560 [Pyrinomonadaceae bacterium]|jgi:hypothetical protein|nr:hypothetical protein [Pyrinomonadaceae bacterium]
MPSVVHPHLNPLRLLLIACCVALAACLCSCAGASQPPDAAGPRAGEPPYPILLTDDQNRREAVLATWATLTREAGANNAPAPELQPVTASVQGLPQTSTPVLYLPKVGTGATMSEEETREALRRFIVSESRLIGADPQQLTLELRTDEADGTKKARYQQQPYRRPLRGGYGVLEISFTDDRRIRQIYSTCIPETERLRAAFVNLRLPTPKAEDVAKRLIGRTLTYTDANGNAQSLTVGNTVNEITVRELVIYPRLRAGQPSALELHMAWELTLGNESSAKTVYLDAVTDEVLAVS